MITQPPSQGRVCHAGSIRWMPLRARYLGIRLPALRLAGGRVYIRGYAVTVYTGEMRRARGRVFAVPYSVWKEWATPILLLCLKAPRPGPDPKPGMKGISKEASSKISPSTVLTSPRLNCAVSAFP